MNWHEYDERLIRRGELILDLDFVKNYKAELDAMNKGNEGKRFTLTGSYVQFLALVRYLYGMPYRQLEGFTRALKRFVEVPSADYTSLRDRVIRVDVEPFRDLARLDEPLTIAIDSTGVKIHKSGGWMERTYGKKKRCVKVHFAVNVKTKEVVGMEVTTDEVHDSKVAERLVDGAATRGDVKEVIGDGAYDTARLYEHLHNRGIDAVIKPRRNSILNTPSRARQYHVDLYRNLGYRSWAAIKGYGRRWSVETAYSTFKRVFGEPVMAKTLDNVVRELMAKVSLYNILVRI